MNLGEGLVSGAKVSAEEGSAGVEFPGNFCHKAQQGQTSEPGGGSVAFAPGMIPQHKPACEAGE